MVRDNGPRPFMPGGGAEGGGGDGEVGRLRPLDADCIRPEPAFKPDLSEGTGGGGAEGTLCGEPRVGGGGGSIADTFAGLEVCTAGKGGGGGGEGPPLNEELSFIDCIGRGGGGGGGTLVGETAFSFIGGVCRGGGGDGDSSLIEAEFAFNIWVVVNWHGGGGGGGGSGGDLSLKAELPFKAGTGSSGPLVQAEFLFNTGDVNNGHESLGGGGGGDGTPLNTECSFKGGVVGGG